MQTQQAQVAAINKDIEGCNSAIAKANVGIKTAARWVRGHLIIRMQCG